MKMTPPPQATLNGSQAGEETPEAVSFRVTKLLKRKDFLRAARARHVATPAFVLQMRSRPLDECGPDIRVGYTCSKKVGNAVARNRAKRRLREAARHVLPELGQPATDYVLIGRREKTASRPFDILVSDLRSALNRLRASDK